MNLKNLLTLTIRVEDYTLVANKPGMIEKLRELTIAPYSGMNHELTSFESISRYRQVNCQILTAYRRGELVGWALLSKEKSDFYFPNASEGFEPTRDGVMFQVFIHPNHRREGIASELLKVARRKVSGDRLAICPHDSPSINFYGNFTHYNHKML